MMAFYLTPRAKDCSRGKGQAHPRLGVKYHIRVSTMIRSFPRQDACLESTEKDAKCLPLFTPSPSRKWRLTQCCKPLYTQPFYKHGVLFLFCFQAFFFEVWGGGTRVWTEGLVFARHVPYSSFYF
jgi:hypothetical protein